MTESLIDFLTSYSLKDVEEIFETFKKERLLDHQKVLDWQDKLNKISTDYYE